MCTGTGVPADKTLTIQGGPRIRLKVPREPEGHESKGDSKMQGGLVDCSRPKSLSVLQSELIGRLLLGSDTTVSIIIVFMGHRSKGAR